MCREHGHEHDLRHNRTNRSASTHGMPPAMVHQLLKSRSLFYGGKRLQESSPPRYSPLKHRSVGRNCSTQDCYTPQGIPELEETYLSSLCSLGEMGIFSLPALRTSISPKQGSRRTRRTCREEDHLEGDRGLRKARSIEGFVARTTQSITDCSKTQISSTQIVYV